MRTPALSAAQLDRAVGVMLGIAAGDALGAGYEFGPALPPATPVTMVGGGSFGWAPGEWTDDTSMAWVIAEVAATGVDLRTRQAQDRIARAWVDWALTAPDVGTQTRAVLTAARRDAHRSGTGPVTAAQLCRAAQAQHQQTGRSGGNGSLMRTAPVAVVYLHDADALVEAAAALSAMTHHDPEAAEACVLWCLAIRHGVLTGTLDARIGLPHLDKPRRAVWARRLDDAEAHEPAHFEANGWVVQALQAAWSAISHTPVPVDDPARGCFRAQHLQHSLEAAVRGGHDTDTVAAIAGGLLGALHGASAVPAAWRRVLHGWPGLRVRDLIVLTERTLREDRPDTFDYTYRAKGDLSARALHPLDDGVRLGAIGALRPLDPDVDAVVSLCRIGDDDVPADAEQIEVRLIDTPDPDANPNLGFVLRDTVETLQALRAEGKTVLLHCVQAQSRTPTVAALYGATISGEPAADVLRQLDGLLPDVNPNRTFRGLMTGHQA